MINVILEMSVGSRSGLEEGEMIFFGVIRGRDWLGKISLRK